MFTQSKGIATIKDGRLQGKKCERNPEVWAFLGIPYADAPVGENRWKEPQPVKAWEGVRDATKYAPDCPQVTLPKGSFYQVEFYPNEKVMDEAQGLALNVWTPAKEGEKLPVLVWIHGGAFREGSGGALQFIGETLAMKGIVVVTINYRMGALGFMAHPELTKAQGGASGNYGFMDQAAAIKWVHENIASFGGDPEKVTIDGQSAGSMSVMAMLSTSLTRGLFRGAICQSGAAFGRMMAGAKTLRSTLEDAEKTGLKLQEALGCGSLEEMRKVSPERIMEVTDECGLAFRPIIDGKVIEEDYMERFAAGRQNVVNVMMGCTCDEGCLHETENNDYENYLAAAKLYGDKEAEYKRVFPAANNEEAGRVTSYERSARLFAGMRVGAEYQMLHGADAYLYSYAQTLPNADGSQLGPFHSAELVYQFGTLYTGWRPWREEDYKASEVMMTYWSNFVKYGDPNGEDLPKWEKHAAGDEKCMVLKAQPEMTDVPRKEQAKFMETLIKEGNN